MKIVMRDADKEDKARLRERNGSVGSNLSWFVAGIGGALARRCYCQQN